ncbi:M28 family peptidase [Faecalibacter macacae]|uniref:Carboxypeptidase Q n=1 Tax=Faecalibacter macacae TaxID=1859289 RepID=A0A3L9M0L7_9FLAO|nr:M28 family peptidase [Faecalibacter macacae]RLZ06472.1 M28 family peptidase [Faecalibacter macacae]
MKIVPIIAISLFSTLSLKAQSNKEILEKINTEVSNHAEAYYLLQKATENIGHRATGTENGKKAEEFAADIFRSYGYDVSFQEFNFKGWNRNSLTLEINEKKIKSVALAHSPALSQVESELVDLGNGLEEDYLKLSKKLDGQIVFAALGLIEDTSKDVKNLHRSEKTALAIKYGAKGIILYNQAKGGILLTGTASVTGDIIEIPAVNISYEDGMLIKQALKSEKVLGKIDMKNDVGPMKGRNVIARRLGQAIPEEKIVLGGHLDSWDLATGAIDNGVGSFSILDVARTYQKLNLENNRTIEFVLFMGEEIGLLGSKNYVAEAIKDGSIKQIKAMSNMDMTTNPKAYFSTMDTSLSFLNGIAKEVKSYIPDFKETASVNVGLHSDHQPFMLEGIPIIGLSESKFKKGALNCYHANCDSFEFVEELGLKNNVLLETYLLYKLSNEKNFPSKKWSEDEIQKELIKANLETPLRISGDWRWK